MTTATLPLGYFPNPDERIGACYVPTAADASVLEFECLATPRVMAGIAVLRELADFGPVVLLPAYVGPFTAATLAPVAVVA